MIRTLTVLLLFVTRIAMGQQDTAILKTDCKICFKGNHLDSKPYYIKFRRELPFLAAGFAITALAMYAEFNNKVQPFTEAELLTLDRSEINSFDRNTIDNWSPTAHKASNVLISTATFLPILFIANRYTRSDMISLTVMSAEVLLINFGVTVLTKNSVNRARPLTYNASVPLEERMNSTSRESFFSGHSSHTTAASIFMAKVVTDYHPNMNKGLKIGIWSTMAVLPAVTAYLRVKAGKHFPSDVIVGYFVGGAIGYLVPQLHKMQTKKLSPKLSLMPTIGIDYTALTMRIRL